MGSVSFMARCQKSQTILPGYPAPRVCRALHAIRYNVDYLGLTDQKQKEDLIAELKTVCGFPQDTKLPPNEAQYQVRCVARPLQYFRLMWASSVGLALFVFIVKISYAFYLL